MSLFTVEQLELIRRLRSTGCTAEQVVEAFNQLKKMEENPPSPTEGLLLKEDIPSPILIQHLKSQHPIPVTISAASPRFSPERISVQTVPPASEAEATVAFPRYDVNAGGRPIRSLRTPMNDIIILDNPAELEEFMKQGEEACIQDMKQFITQYSLRQTTVALMTGVSQPYISKLFGSHHKELSLRCRKNIYCWYLNCRRHPEKLAAFLADPSTRLETNGEGELIPQRRERYVFRPVLLRLLEGFFTQTPFPDISRRIEIATMCNQILQAEKKGVGLMPKEVVSPQVVANWFANKRKELRRRSQENHEAPPLLEASSCLEDSNSVSGSTPSPHNESGRQSMERSQDGSDHILPTIDISTIAARLGLPVPKLEEVSISLPQPLLLPSQPPIVTLASQLLQHSSPLLTTFPFEDQLHSLNSLAMAYQQLQNRPMLKLDSVE